MADFSGSRGLGHQVCQDYLERCRGRYGAGRLAGWAGTFSAWLKEGLDVYCYFDNDEAGYAAQDALRLKQMMLEG